MNKHWKKLSRNALIIAALSVGTLVSCKKDELSGAASPPAQAGDEFIVDANDKPIEGRYVIVFKEQEGLRSSLSATEKRAGVRRLASSVLSKSGQRAEIEDSKIFSRTISGFVAEMNAAQAEELRKDDRIAYIVQDRVITLGRRGWSKATWNVPTEPLKPNTQKNPWGVRKVGGAGNGSGKVAWVIDSGIDLLHPDLNVDGYRSVSFLSSQNKGNWQSPADESGHGTHVAGIIAAKNNSFGVVGVAAGATVISLRVFDASNRGDASVIIQALEHVYAHGKPGDVVNLSLGSDAFAPLDDAVRKVASRGIYVAVAAGNDAEDCKWSSPARVNAPNVYTVSASDSLNVLASFSNFGEPVDFSAPGKQILSTYKNKQYAWLSGTSMAAPHVAGILLLNGGKINYATTVSGDPDGRPDKLAKR